MNFSSARALKAPRRLARKRLARLRETEPVWLPDYAVVEGKPLHLFSLFALAFTLARELSGEAQLQRAHQAAGLCDCAKPEHVVAQKQLYAQVTEQRFKGVNRCC